MFLIQLNILEVRFNLEDTELTDDVSVAFDPLLRNKLLCMKSCLFMYCGGACGFVGEVAGPTSGVEEEDENEEVDDVVAGAGADAADGFDPLFLLKTGILVSLRILVSAGDCGLIGDCGTDPFLSKSSDVENTTAVGDIHASTIGVEFPDDAVIVDALFSIVVLSLLTFVLIYNGSLLRWVCSLVTTIAGVVVLAVISAVKFGDAVVSIVEFVLLEVVFESKASELTLTGLFLFFFNSELLEVLKVVADVDGVEAEGNSKMNWVSGDLDDGDPDNPIEEGTVTAETDVGTVVAVAVAVVVGGVGGVSIVILVLGDATLLLSPYRNWGTYENDLFPFKEGKEEEWLRYLLLLLLLLLRFNGGVTVRSMPLTFSDEIFIAFDIIFDWS